MIALAITALLAMIPHSHVTAASRAALVYRVDAAVLLAIADHETHHRSELVSSAMACGPMQVLALDLDDCVRMSDVSYGYLVGARTLRQWMNETHGDLRLALLGYGCGHQRGTKHAADQCNGFELWVIGRSMGIRWTVLQ